ncbi:MAG: restriction endonuclease subunit S [Gammaproteobacteria bacterium]
MAFYRLEVSSFTYPIEKLKRLIVGKPQYGANERGIERITTDIPRYIRITDIDEYGRLRKDIGVTAEVVEEKYILANGDLLFARSGNTVGKAYLHHNSESERCLFAGYMIRFRANVAKVMPEHVFLCTQLAFYKHWVAATQRATGQPNINAEEYRNLELPVPPDLDVQKSLVQDYYEALARYEQRMTKASNLLAGIDAYLLAELGITLPPEPENTIANRIFTVQRKRLAGKRFDPLFHKPWHKIVNESLLSSTYHKVYIRDICHSPVGGATPTRGDAELYDTAGIKFLRIQNIGKDELILDDVKFIKQAVHDGDLCRSQLREDDVLLTITGRVGTAAVVSIDILPANINQHIVRLRLRRNDCLPGYLSAYLNSAIGFCLSNRGVTGGTRIALDYPTIGSLQIPLPPIATQEAILQKITAIRAEAKRLRTEAGTELETAKRRIEAMLLGEPE